MDGKRAQSDASEINDSDSVASSGREEEESSDSECPETSYTDNPSAFSNSLTSDPSDFDLEDAGASLDSTSTTELLGQSGASSSTAQLLSKAKEMATRSFRTVTRGLSPKKEVRSKESPGSPSKAAGTSKSEASPTAWSKLKLSFSPVKERSPKSGAIAKDSKGPTGDKGTPDAKEANTTSPKKSFVRECLDKLYSPKKSIPAVVPPPPEFVDVDLTESVPVAEAAADPDVKERRSSMIADIVDKFNQLTSRPVTPPVQWSETIGCDCPPNTPDDYCFASGTFHSTVEPFRAEEVPGNDIPLRRDREELDVQEQDLEDNQVDEAYSSQDEESARENRRASH